MNKIILKIGESSYNLKFGFGCFRHLSEAWEVPGFPEVMGKIIEVSQNIEKMQFADLKMIQDVIYAAVCANGDIEEIQNFNFDDCGDLLMNEPGSVAKVFEALMASMPKPESEPVGKPKAVKKPKASTGTDTK